MQTALRGQCVKLWVNFPGTTDNCAMLRQLDSDDACFVKALRQLQGVRFTLTDDSIAIRLPPGCIHGTVTLSGGLTTGIEFSSESSLKAAASFFDTFVATNVKSPIGQYRPLLESLKLSFQSLEPDKRQQATIVLCERFLLLRKGPRDNYIFNETLNAAKQMNDCCQGCYRLWSNHGYWAGKDSHSFNHRQLRQQHRRDETTQSSSSFA